MVRSLIGHQQPISKIPTLEFILFLWALPRTPPPQGVSDKINQLEHFLGHRQSGLIFNWSEERNQHDLVFMLDPQTCHHEVSFTIQAEISPITCMQV